MTVFINQINKFKNNKMNSSFVTISILVKSNLTERCLINILMNISSQSLRSYLKLASIYDGNSNTRKTDLVEMILYGCITNKFNKEPIKDISVNKAYNKLKEKDILIKSLPGYGNMRLKKKDIKPYVSECSIKRLISMLLFLINNKSILYV